MTVPLLKSIHHVAVICSDYPRSRAFYHETLGLPIVHEVYREMRQSWKCDLQVSPGVQLELFSFPAPPRRQSRPEAQGLRHLAFLVDDIDASIATLLARGTPCEPCGWMNTPGAGLRFLPTPMICRSSSTQSIERCR